MTTYSLVVVQPFGDYKRGDKITDQSKIQQILDVQHEDHVLSPYVVKVLNQESEAH